MIVITYLSSLVFKIGFDKTCLASWSSGLTDLKAPAGDPTLLLYLGETL